MLQMSQIENEVKPVVSELYNNIDFELKGKQGAYFLVNDNYDINIYCKVSNDKRFWGANEESLLKNCTHIMFVSHFERSFFLIEKQKLQTRLNDQVKQKNHYGRPLTSQYKYEADIIDGKLKLIPMSKNNKLKPLEDEPYSY